MLLMLIGVHLGIYAHSSLNSSLYVLLPLNSMDNNAYLQTLCPFQFLESLFLQVTTYGIHTEALK